ncbi:transcription factor 19 [Ascaphus truei]|uniref:transcription factor 19 n=1 Tax=Ascaphus truei TaxID=8439 RepID=UPI003F595EE1
MVGSVVALSQVQPCFQLLRMGSEPGPPASGHGPPSRDLYTFLPDSPRCAYRLGARPDLCDVPLPGSPRVHAQIHAERDGDGDWGVTLETCADCGTFINDVPLPRGQRSELSDGDLLRFDRSPPSSPATYFLFQRVRVRPLDFSAITSPRARAPPGFTPVLGTPRLSGAGGATPHYTTGATVILTSIGSISKMRRQQLQQGGDGEGARPSTPSLPLPSRTGQEVRRRSRRKAQHRVLCEPEEDHRQEEEEEEGGVGNDGGMAKRRRRRREEERRAAAGRVETGRKPRGRPRKHPPLLLSQTVYSAEPCAWRHCRLPQEDTVSWVQCDRCDSWYHVLCIGRSLTSVQDTDFHCGCT